MSTWDSLSPDEREASGKGYDTPTPREQVDAEDGFDLHTITDGEADDVIDRWLDAMFEDHRLQLGGYE